MGGVFWAGVLAWAQAPRAGWPGLRTGPAGQPHASIAFLPATGPLAQAGWTRAVGKLGASSAPPWVVSPPLLSQGGPADTVENHQVRIGSGPETTYRRPGGPGGSRGHSPGGPRLRPWQTGAVRLCSSRHTPSPQGGADLRRASGQGARHSPHRGRRRQQQCKAQRGLHHPQRYRASLSFSTHLPRPLPAAAASQQDQSGVPGAPTLLQRWLRQPSPRRFHRRFAPRTAAASLSQDGRRAHPGTARYFSIDLCRLCAAEHQAASPESRPPWTWRASRPEPLQ